MHYTENYPFTVFKTRSSSERVPLRADHGTSALIKGGVGPTCFIDKEVAHNYLNSNLNDSWNSNIQHSESAN